MCVPFKRTRKVHPIVLPIRCENEIDGGRYKDLPVLTERDEYEIYTYLKTKEESTEHIIPQLVVVKNKNVNVV